MEIVIIIAKSAAILTLFYVLYITVLRKDTFFTANRHYLLTGIIAALVIPFIEFTKTVYVEMPITSSPVFTEGNFTPLLLENTPQAIAPEINWWSIALVIYCVGVLLLLGRLFIQLISLNRLLLKYPNTRKGKFTYVHINDNIAPFSFFRTICFNPALHTREELDMIIAHEKVHAKQLHTIDVLLTQVLLAFQWINPLAWYYKKSLEQNLEFLADSGALQAVHSVKAYQHTLVKVSSTALRPALTNQFYHSLIKKRIVMLNKETSRRRNLLKLGLILPVLGLFMYSFNVKEVIKYNEIAIVEKETAFAKADSEIPVKTDQKKQHTNKEQVIKEGLTVENTAPIEEVTVQENANDTKDGVLESIGTSLLKDDRYATDSKQASKTSEIAQDPAPFKIEITKDFTKEELDALVTTLKTEHDVRFSYSDLDYNANNEITSLGVQIKDELTGNTSNTHTSSNSPIGMIIIERRANGGLSIRTVANQADEDIYSEERHLERNMELRKRSEERREEMEARRNELLENREERLEEMKAQREEMRSNMKERGNEMKEEMRARREEMRERMKKQKEKIKEKQDRGYVTMDSTTYYFANVNGETQFFDRYGVVISEEDPLYERLFKNSKSYSKETSLNKAIFDFKNFDKDPLVIVDGKVYKKRPIDLDPNQIKNVNVLKGKKARAFYGKKGENGVVVIEMKD